MVFEPVVLAIVCFYLFFFIIYSYCLLLFCRVVGCMVLFLSFGCLGVWQGVVALDIDVFFDGEKSRIFRSYLDVSKLICYWAYFLHYCIWL